jgi:tetratricopeptide (TPR) repeat protein
MRKLTESNNTRATARYLEGLGLLEAFHDTREWERLEAAENQFTEATHIDPFYKAARFYLGVSQEMIGKHEEAANEFERLRLEELQNDQPDFELLYNLSLSYFHQYSRPAYQQAEKYLKYLLESTSRPSEKGVPGEQSTRRESVRMLAGTLLAQVYSHLSILPVGTTEEQFRPQAEKFCELASETATSCLAEFQAARERIDPQLTKDVGWGIHNAIGHALLYSFKRDGKKNLLEASINEFTQALQFDPENYRVLSNLGTAYFFAAEWAQNHIAEVGHGGFAWKDQLKLAEQFFQAVLTIKPKYDFAFFRLAEIALLRGNWNEAREFVDLARQNHSEMTSERLNSLLENIERAQASASSESSYSTQS